MRAARRTLKQAHFASTSANGTSGLGSPCTLFILRSIYTHLQFVKPSALHAKRPLKTEEKSSAGALQMPIHRCIGRKGTLFQGHIIHKDGPLGIPAMHIDGDARRSASGEGDAQEGIRGADRPVAAA